MEITNAELLDRLTRLLLAMVICNGIYQIVILEKIEKVIKKLSQEEEKE